MNNKESEKKSAIVPEPESRKPLLRNNYLMMAVAALLIVVGFILMSGSGSTEEAYNPEIFSTRRIVVGPIVSFIGYVFMAVAIIIKPRN